MAKNIIEKIWDAHVILQETELPAILAIDKMLLHEATSAQAFEQIRARKLTVNYPEKFIATLDHCISTERDRTTISDKSVKQQVNTLRKNTAEYGIKLFDFGSAHQGIVHVMGPELGFVQPGETVVCGDSHTSTHGAFGAMAFGIGTSEVAHVLATNSLLQYQPRSMNVEFTGTLKDYVFAKDVIMLLISKIGIGGAKGFAIEYTGSVIRQMNMASRMTLCNMSIECGARCGLISPDKTTFDYLQNKTYTPKKFDVSALKNRWCSDVGCDYDLKISINVDKLEPMVSWGTNPEQAISIQDNLPLPSGMPAASKLLALKAYEYTRLQPGRPIKGTKVDWAFMGSCTNGRIEDLRIAAAILKNRKLSNHVKMLVVPGSEHVYQQACNEKLDQIFLAAGAEFRLPGCSMCVGMNEDKVPAGQRCISSSNRNFIGRQGPGSITHIASPSTVAASAVAGEIISSKDL